MITQRLVGVFFVALFFCATVAAQTTAFTYQGSLQSGGSPANGNFDFEFRLFDALVDGTQQGSTLQSLNVTVTNGIFTALLDFGATTLPGTDRFLDISVRTGGGGAFSSLTPRTKIASGPYSIKSLNAASANSLSASCVGCVTAAHIGGVNGNTVTGAIPVASVPAGSGSYIQNTTTQQATSNFNISGTGTAGSLNARTQFQFNGERILGTPGFNGNQNLVVGIGTGVGISNGDNNSLFGFRAGMNLINGSENAFFGANAGAANQIGNNNSFFGKGAGILNNGGDNNTFIGYHAGQANTTGDYNSFVGMYAGQSNVTGIENSFFGYYAGRFTTGNQNTFVGYNAGSTNDTGGQNTALGHGTNFGLNNLSYATVIGAGASVSGSNSIQLGRLNMDRVSIGMFVSGGSTAVCNLANNLAMCSSSRRYKENIIEFGGGLEIVRRFRPVSFDWKERNERDIGLIAEEVAEIEPLLVTHNSKNEIEGVKYGQFTVVLINAIKQQQSEIESQQKQIEQQRSEIEALKALVCLQNPGAAICRPKN